MVLRGRRAYPVLAASNLDPTMNPTITFPAPEPSLRLRRPAIDNWAATLAEERRRLLEDQEALREREQNLRNYEARLRALQHEIEAGRSAPAATVPPTPATRSSRVPFEDAAALPAAWDKLHRARELLEAEQAHLREDRHAMREQEAAMKRREEAVAAREAAVAEREALLPEPGPEAGEPVAAEHTLSAVTRLTRAPFNMARSIFGGGK